MRGDTHDPVHATSDMSEEEEEDKTIINAHRQSSTSSTNPSYLLHTNNVSTNFTMATERGLREDGPGNCQGGRRPSATCAESNNAQVEPPTLPIIYPPTFWKSSLPPYCTYVKDLLGWVIITLDPSVLTNLSSLSCSLSSEFPDLFHNPLPANRLHLPFTVLVNAVANCVKRRRFASLQGVVDVLRGIFDHLGLRAVLMFTEAVVWKLLFKNDSVLGSCIKKAKRAVEALESECGPYCTFSNKLKMLGHLLTAKHYDTSSANDVVNVLPYTTNSVSSSSTSPCSSSFSLLSTPGIILVKQTVVAVLLCRLLRDCCQAMYPHDVSRASPTARVCDLCIETNKITSSALLLNEAKLKTGEVNVISSEHSRTGGRAQSLECAMDRVL